MKLNKIVYWIIIGMLCYLPLCCFIYLFVLLFGWSDEHSGLLQVMLIVVGFIFVCRQIKIEKNKDIFLNFQRKIEAELNFHRDRNYKFFCKVQDFRKLNKNYSSSITDTFQFWKELTQQYWDIYCEYERIFYTDFTSLNEWWLGEFNVNLQELQNSKEYKNYIEFTRVLYYKHVDFFKSTSPSNRKLSDMIEIAFNEYQQSICNLEILDKKFNELLKTIAKQKGVL